MRDGPGNHTPSFSYLFYTLCSLWEARPRPRHTDWSNGPATYETSFSGGERATITTLFDCRSLENRKLAREASECARAHGKYATPSHFSRWRSTTATKSRLNAISIRPILLYMTYGNSGCGLETHTALACASCCMSVSTTPLVPVNHV